MAGAMEVRALLVSTDNITASMVRRSLNSVGVTPEEGVKVEDVMGRVRKQRFEAIVVDLSVPGARELLEQLRSDSSTKQAVLFALATGKASMREAFQLGATFVLEKPLSLDRTVRCFRAAHGLIVGERRRYYRHRISVAVMVMRGAGEPVTGYSVDVSTGGMLMDISTPLEENAQIKLQFSLPGLDEKLVIATEVIWCKGGKAGFRFLRFGRNSKEVLSNWLGQQIDKEMSTGNSMESKSAAFS